MPKHTPKNTLTKNDLKMNIKPITAEQITRMHTLLNTLGMRDDKKELMRFFADENRPVESSKELRYHEAYALIDYLVSVQKMNPEAVKCDRQRKKVISACREVGMNIGHKADMKRINAWVEQYGYLHKPLMEYNSKELPKLVTQANQMRAKFLESL